MALCRRINCDTCHEEKEVWFNSGDPRPNTCGGCTEKKVAEARQAHLNALAQLPIEERLRKLEEFAYDHSRRFHSERPVRF